MIFADRVDATNAVLARILPAVHLEIQNNLLICCWAQGGKKYRKPWTMHWFLPEWDFSFLSERADFFFVAYLVRWCFGQPTMPLPELRNRDRLNATPWDILENAGYPDSGDCLLCGTLITSHCFWHNELSLCGPICLSCAGYPELDWARSTHGVDDGILSYVSVEAEDEPHIVIDIPSATNPEDNGDDEA